MIITPHVSTVSDLGHAARIAIAAENLRRYVAGEKMLSVVDLGPGLLGRAAAASSRKCRGPTERVTTRSYVCAGVLVMSIGLARC